MLLNNADATIMIVDDVAENLTLLLAILGNEGYNLRAYPNGQMALDGAFQDPPDLILLDVMMPDLDGYEVCRRLKADQRFHAVPIIFISALSATFDKIKAFEAGGVDYIPKPFQTAEVLARVKVHLENKYLQAEITRHNQELQNIVREQVKEITDGHLAMIVTITKLAETRDDDTGRHIERTQLLCRTLAEHLQKTGSYQQQIDTEFLENIFNASPLHDIGKIAIPDNILLKPGKLTPPEFEIMKTHAEVGARYLTLAYDKARRNQFLRMGIEIAANHHEKWDGTGYPQGLAGERIPLSGRIMALVDVYDAMRSKRVYKEALGHDQSKEIIYQSAGTHLDPTIVEAFREINQEFAAIRDGMEN